MTKLYLAGNFRGNGKVLQVTDKLMAEQDTRAPYFLSSYYYCRPESNAKPIGFRHREKLNDFILDSGAYTFMEAVSTDPTNTDFEQYARDYAHFVKENGVQNYVELDIDSVVGLHRVRELRDIIESITGRNPIPVWHKSRGKESFIKVAKKYDHISIGGIVSGEFTKDEYKYFNWFVDKAHEHGAKIHGLGFTPSNIGEYGFDSVDSTSWLSAQKFGTVHQFTGSGLKQIDRPGRSKYPENTRHNFKEWVKYARYLNDD